MINKEVIIGSKCEADVRVRRNRRNSHHPWFWMRHGFVKKAVCFLCYNIRRVLAFVAYWRCSITSHMSIQVLVGVRIQEEVRSIEAVNIRTIVIVDRMSVPEFASVVSVVSSLLHPNWKIVVVDSLLDNLRIPACEWLELARF